ncbi:hypothetical protein [Lignipirellula cremea]|nr:hypothetical protein [Lignipirellula cremea]
MCGSGGAQPADRPETVTPRDVGIGPPQSAAEKAIRAALEKPYTGQLENTPLRKVIGAIAETYQINVALDHRDLGGVGIDGDTPVSYAGNSSTLRSALKQILQELELVWVIQDETLLITTPYEVEDILVTRLYEVQDLVMVPRKKPLLWGPGGLDADFDTLQETITSTIAPDTWDEVGGPGSFQGGSFGGRYLLVVSQSESVHKQIADLFQSMRTVRPPAPAEEKPSDEKTTLHVYRLSADAAGKSDELTAVLKKIVEPESWQQPGVQLEAAADALIIRQTPAVHESIGELLQAMGALAPSLDYYDDGGRSRGFSGGSMGFGFQ